MPVLGLPVSTFATENVATGGVGGGGLDSKQRRPPARCGLELLYLRRMTPEKPARWCLGDTCTIQAPFFAKVLEPPIRAPRIEFALPTPCRQADGLLVSGRRGREMETPLCVQDTTFVFFHDPHVITTHMLGARGAGISACARRAAAAVRPLEAAPTTASQLPRRSPSPRARL